MSGNLSLVRSSRTRPSISAIMRFEINRANSSPALSTANASTPFEATLHSYPSELWMEEMISHKASSSSTIRMRSLLGIWFHRDWSPAASGGVLGPPLGGDLHSAVIMRSDNAGTDGTGPIL